MGKAVTPSPLSFVSFKPSGCSFQGFLSIEAVAAGEQDPEATLRKATRVYELAIKRMRSVLAEIERARANHKPVRARKMWDIGEAVFKLRDKLQSLSLELDGVYDHLVRDLGVKRKWLEKPIIFRRYLPDKQLVPTSLRWGRCEKGTRRVALRLAQGLPLD